MLAWKWNDTQLLLTNLTYRNQTDVLPSSFQYVCQILALLTIAHITFSFGCALDLEKVRFYLNKPRQLETAIFLQLLLMPALGYGVARILRMSLPETIGVLYQTVVPGGLATEVLSRTLDGDADLSIAMTTTSILLAVGSVPMRLVFITAMIDQKNQLPVPLSAIGMAFVVSFVPLFIGNLMRCKFSQMAQKISKVTWIAGCCLFMASLLYSLHVGKTSLLTPSCIKASSMLIIASLTISYIASHIPFLKFEPSSRRTLSLELLLLHPPLAFALIMLLYSSSPPDAFFTMIVFPNSFGFVQVALLVFVVPTYLITKKLGSTCLAPSKYEDIDREVDCEDNRSPQPLLR